MAARSRKRLSAMVAPESAPAEAAAPLPLLPLLTAGGPRREAPTVLPLSSESLLPLAPSSSSSDSSASAAFPPVWRAAFPPALPLCLSTSGSFLDCCLCSRLGSQAPSPWQT